MFVQDFFPVFTRNDGGVVINSNHPISCYTSKENTLKKFLNLKEQEEILENMSLVLEQLFPLWDAIECDLSKIKTKFSIKSSSTTSLFYQNPLEYKIPEGLLYPIVGAFRALVIKDEKTGRYYWVETPVNVWKKIRNSLISIVLTEKCTSVSSLIKNKNLWDNLLKEVCVYSLF